MPRLGLFGVFHGENGIGHRSRKVQSHARNTRARFVGHQFKMIRFTTDHTADGDQGIVLGAIGQSLQGNRYFERTGHLHQRYVLGLDAQLHEFGQTGLGHGVRDVGVEARLHQSDAQLLAIQLIGDVALICIFHENLPNCSQR